MRVSPCRPVVRAALAVALVAHAARPAAAEVPAPPGVEGGAPAADPAGADPAAPPPRPPAREVATGYSHKGQVLASLRTGVGLRAIVPYERAVYCGATSSDTGSGNAPVCAGRAPFSIDLELGYGLARKVDVFVELRLGLEADFGPIASSLDDGPAMFHVSPGARFYFSEGKRTKLFTTAQVVFDFAGYTDPGTGEDRGADLGIRNLTGLWLDLGARYGVYAYVGETLTVARWLRFELEAGIGIQGRYP